MQFRSQSFSLQLISSTAKIGSRVRTFEHIFSKFIDQIKASIISVQDNVALEEGVITVPSKVLVGGKNLLIGGNADEWCRLLAQNGEVAATPTVLENTGGTLDLDFGELPPDGTYTLVVSARNGASTDLAPAVARKTVVIKNNQ